MHITLWIKGKASSPVIYFRKSQRAWAWSVEERGSRGSQRDVRGPSRRDVTGGICAEEWTDLT